MRRLKYWQAISEATVQCMEADPSIFIAGIGVDDFKGIFGTTLAAAREAVAAARENRPYFLECTTYRWREHVGPLWDYEWGYRTNEEVDGWIARCPIKRATERLIAEGALGAADVKALEGELQAEVDRAVAAAKAAPFPAVEDLMLGTY